MTQKDPTGAALRAEIASALRAERRTVAQQRGVAVLVTLACLLLATVVAVLSTLEAGLLTLAVSFVGSAVVAGLVRQRRRP